MSVAVPPLGDAPVTLDLASGDYAICRLDSAAAVPQWALAGDFWSITRTPQELSVVVAQECVPADVAAQRDWRRLAVRGPIPFDVVGLLAGLAAALAGAGASVFPLATHDTDHLLVPAADLERALAALRAAGCQVFTR